MPVSSISPRRVVLERPGARVGTGGSDLRKDAPLYVMFGSVFVGGYFLFNGQMLLGAALILGAPLITYVTAKVFGWPV